MAETWETGWHEANGKITATLVLDHPGASRLRWQVAELDTVAWGASLAISVEHSLTGNDGEWFELDNTTEITAAVLRSEPYDVRGIRFSRLRISTPHASDKRLSWAMFATGAET